MYVISVEYDYIYFWPKHDTHSYTAQLALELAMGSLSALIKYLEVT